MTAWLGSGLESKSRRVDGFTWRNFCRSDERAYFKILVKSLENYISKVQYMGNAILSQLSSADNLSELCDLIVSFLPLDYSSKKKYITTIDSISRAKYLIEDMSRDMKFAEL